MAEDNNELLIRIRAELDELKKGIQDSKGEIDKFAKGAGEVGSELDDVTESGKKAGKAIGKSGLGKEAKDATTNLGKTAQATEDLQRGLSDLAGGNVGGLADVTKGFSAFASTLTGTIAIAGTVALAYGGMLFALKKYGEYRRDQLDEKLQWQEMLGAVKEYEKGLWGLAKTRLDGAKSVAGEITKLDQLRAAAEDATRTTKERESAIAEMRKLYPSYFKDIDDESIKIGALPGIYDKLTDSILAQGRARAALNTLIDNQGRQIALEAQLAAKSAEIQDLATARDKVKLQEKYITQLSGAAAYNSKIAGFQDRINDKIKEQSGIADNMTKNQEAALKLSNEIKANGGILPVSPGGSKTGDDDPKPLSSPIEDFYDNTLKVTPKLKSAFDEIAELYGGLSTAIDETPPLTIYKDDVAAAQEEKLKRHLANMSMILDDFNQEATRIVESGITNTFAGIGSAIGTALAEGGNAAQAGGQALLQGVASILVQLGELAIATGVGLLAIELALDSMNPYLAIAAGVALVALGSAIGAATKGMSAEMSSGRSGGSRSSMSGVTGSSDYSGGSSISTSSGMSGDAGGTYVFKIAGTELIGVIENSLARNKSLGGSSIISG